jgi:hypothetical protein
MLVDCYPTLDEAVLAAWTGSCVPRSAAMGSSELFGTIRR